MIGGALRVSPLFFSYFFFKIEEIQSVVVFSFS